MKNKVFKVSVIIAMILTMTMSNFIFVGNSLISYALDDVSTNHKNVEFSAYLKDENGQNVTQLSANAGQMEANLFIKMAVKQEGYFNGQIELGNANFRIKEEVGTSGYINKIEENAITLNQINAGSTVEIELKVELVRKEIFDLSLLNMESEIKLKGIYKDSSEKDISINSSKNVQLSYQEADISNENVLSQLEVITNKNMTINGEQRHVVQILLRLGLKDNGYPIENIALENIAPQTEDESKIETSQIVNLNTMTHWSSNTKTSTDNTKTTIEMKNEENNGKIIWKKQGNEEIILTYIAKPGASIKSQNIAVTGKIMLYNKQEVEINASTDFDKTEEKNATITAKTTNPENVIYKGKLYQGVDRAFSTETTVNVNLANAHDYLEIKEDNLWEQPEQEENSSSSANMVFQSTVINKKEWMDLLGEDGNITISNKAGITVATIDKNTQEDEQGNIVINYGEGQEGIIIRTTKPVNTGKLHVTQNKMIKDNRNVNLDSIAYLKTITYVTNNIVTEGTIQENEENVAEVELSDSKTEAKLEINKQSLSVSASNRVELKATLKSATEENDLYKNPILQVELPKEVEEINIHSINKLYDEDNEFALEYDIDTTQDGRKAIQIKMQGEQTKYANNISGGIQVIIDADLVLTKVTASKSSEIVMHYTNENGSENLYETKTNVDIIAREGIIIYSKLSNYNKKGDTVDTIDNEELRANLDLQEPRKYAKVERTIINNAENDMEKIVVVGTIESKSTIDTTLESVMIGGAEGKIYYSTEANATADSDTWKEDSTNAKSYKVVIETDTIGERNELKINYNITIPEELGFSQNIYEKMDMTYIYGGQNFTKTSTAYLSTIAGDSQEAMNTYTKTTPVEGVGELGIVALTGGQVLKDGDNVYEGQAIKYMVTVKNNTQNDINNAKITVEHKNANLIDAVAYEMADSFDKDKTITSYYMEEVEGLNKKQFELETIGAGETKTIEYQVVVKKEVTNTSGTITLSAGENIEQTVETNENKVEEGALKLNINYGLPVDYNLQPDTKAPVTLETYNISQTEQNDVIVEFRIPEGLKIAGIEEASNFEILEEDTNYLKCKISSIAPNTKEEIIVSLSLANSNPTEDMTAKIHYAAILASNNYSSNEVTVTNKLDENIKNHLEVTQTANVSEEIVQTGDKVIFTIKVANTSDEVVKIDKIMDDVPIATKITSAYYRVNNDMVPIENIENNSIQISDIEIEANSEIQLVIETEVEEFSSSTPYISNYALVTPTEGRAISSNTIQYTLKNLLEEEEEIKKDNEKFDEKEEDEEIIVGEGEEKPEPLPDPITTKNISGVAWLEENKDGERQDSEKRLSGITVRLINADTEEYIAAAKTDGNGKYQFKNIPLGNYMIAFEYDTSKYTLTEYKKEGVEETINSDVTTHTITIKGEEKTVALTDILNLTNNNIESIDMGLVENSIFDLTLDKYINKVILQTNSGTTVKEYDKEQLAKIELDAKQIANTTVLIEYTIQVKNEGEIAGYVNEIVDYKPNDLSFNSEINKEWYTSVDGNLHTTILSDEIIQPGETKTVTLTLTKVMNENNTGRTANVAEIVKSSNDLSIADIDSIAGNKSMEEDDISTAEIIISIRTGEGIAVVAGIITILIILGMIGYFVYYIRRREV